MRACTALILLLSVLTLAACDKPAATTNRAAPSNAAPASSGPAATEPAPPASASAPTTSMIKKIEAADLKVGDYLPPLDGGKIEIPSPAGWTPMPRDSKYLVRFYHKSRNGLPLIDITVEDKNLGGLTSVTEANLAEFTAAVAKDLEASRTAVLEPPLPMVIGSVPCARYVSHLKLKIIGSPMLVERQTLDLLHAGRLYKINLFVERDTLLASRDAAYAVCSGIRFHEVQPPVAAEPAATAEPAAAAEPPAAAKPPTAKE